MKCLILLASILALAGCSVAVSPDTPAPFANSVRFSDLVNQQAESAASTVTEVRSTNTLLGELIDQQKIAAGQQCDLLKEIIDLKASLAPVPAQPAPAPTVSAPPLWTSESDEGEPTIEGPRDVPVGATITINGETTAITEFIRQWYRGPWDGEPKACLQRFGIDAQFLDRLSPDALGKLHGAVHEHQQATQPKADPAPVTSRHPAVAQSAPAASPCPGGVCPNPASPVYPQPVRRGLFGRLKK